MAQYSASQARTNFQELISLCETEAVEIHRHGKKVAVMLHAMKYEQLLDQIEDLEDKVTLLEYNANPVAAKDLLDLREVEKELGLK